MVRKCEANGRTYGRASSKKRQQNHKSFVSCIVGPVENALRRLRHGRDAAIVVPLAARKLDARGISIGGIISRAPGIAKK
jgi:hypothetical protein